MRKGRPLKDIALPTFSLLFLIWLHMRHHHPGFHRCEHNCMLAHRAPLMLRKPCHSCLCHGPQLPAAATHQIQASSCPVASVRHLCNGNVKSPYKQPSLKVCSSLLEKIWCQHQAGFRAHSFQAGRVSPRVLNAVVQRNKQTQAGQCLGSRDSATLEMMPAGSHQPKLLCCFQEAILDNFCGF